MSVEKTLDRLLIPRPNGSENLDTVADYLAATLAEGGASVSEHTFTATAHGFQLVWLLATIMMALYAWAIFNRRYRVALCIPIILAGLLLLEFEYLVSTISALSNTTERNIIGTYPGIPGGPALIFTAHYDTATHFGDHFSWGFWGRMQGPATGIAIGLALTGLWCQRRQKTVARPVVLGLLPLAVSPFLAMFWFQAIGPVVRTPSVGAIDNGGSVAALLSLAERIQYRAPDAPTTVKIVFLAAEEERTLGSWFYAKSLANDETFDRRTTLVINLESIGTTTDIAYIPEDGFATRRFYSSTSAIETINDTAQQVYGKILEARPLPFGTLTDGRSFLAHSIETITLRSLEEESFPRHLHSEHDSRDRLSIAGLEKTVDFLTRLVQASDSKSRL